MPQQRHVIDRVGPGDHPRDQARDLEVGVDATGLVQSDLLADQKVQAGPLGQLHHRREPGARHEVRVVEDGRDAVTDSHPADALLCVSNRSLDKIDSPAAEGHSVVSTRSQPRSHGGSGLSLVNLRCYARTLIADSGIAVVGTAVLSSPSGRSPCSTRSGAPPTRTSPASVTPCGGPRPPSPPWATETATQGRLVAVVLMRGIALLSVLTAGIAAWFVSQSSEATEASR